MPDAPTPDPTDRLVDLEIRIAHQDMVIDDLNATVVEQWKAIDGLTRRLEALVDRLATVEQNARYAAPPEPPPPHY
jgi:SlyX protein